MTVKDHTDEVTTRDLRYLRTTATVENKSIKIVDTMFQELGKKVAAVDFGKQPDTQQKRLKEFNKEVSTVVDEHLKEIEDEHKLYMYDVLQVEHEEAQNSINKIIGVTALAVLLTKNEARDKINNFTVQGTTIGLQYKRLKTSLKEKINDTLNLGLLNGDEGTKLAKGIVGGRGIVGLKQLFKKQVKSLIKTGANRAINEARVMAFKIHPRIKGMMQVSVLDSRTSDVCKAYAGKKWDTKKNPIGHTLPFGAGVPRHFQCRSSIVPLEDLSEELKGFTFDNYLKGKSKAFQDEVLGKSKADLWRKGNITMTQLVDQSGRPLTLEQLKEL